jgi:hypothetical protein
MTAFTPNITIYTLPPNTAHTDPKTEVTDWVDYRINISRGSSDYITPPYPGQTTVTLLFDENVIPDIEIGSWLEIHVDSSTYLDPPVIHSGNVVDRSSQYRAYGLEGFVLEWSFTLSSGISILQNTSYNLDTYRLDITGFLLNDIIEASARQMWSQVNPLTSWANYGPETWAAVDDSAISQIPALTYNSAAGFGAPTQSLDVGTRNSWDDMVTLVYGMYGWISETPLGDLYVELPVTARTPATFDITQNMIRPDIMGGDRINEIRNQMTITVYGGTSKTYYDSDSVSLYNERSGSLTTYLNGTPAADTVSGNILNALAYPLLSTEKVSVDLLNPNIGDTLRDRILYDPLAMRTNVEAPLPMGGTQPYLVVGINFDISKDSFIADLTLWPLARTYVAQNWLQIPYSYTWTSYGAAYPTQQWQDL